MDEGCICEGNWRNIVAETEPLIGVHYQDIRSDEKVLCGVLWGGDDFYYNFVEVPGGGCSNLSCVGSIESWNLTRLLRCDLCHTWHHPEKIIEHLGDCNVEMET